MKKCACVVLGGGGHARVLLDCFFEQGLRPAGILDPDRSLWGRRVFGVPVWGDDSLLPTLKKRGVRWFVVGLGGAGDNRPRQRVFDKALAAGLRPMTVAHPTAAPSARARIGEGCQLLPRSVVNAGARLGRNVIVNSGAVVEHDCDIASHVHVATGAQLASAVRVGTGAHVGVGASVRQGVTLGERCVVGAGAAVVRDVPAGHVVAGVPARRLRVRRAAAGRKEWR